VTLPPLPPRLEVDVGPGFDRLLHGMRLLRAGKGNFLILSGGTIPSLVGSEVTEAVQLQSLALEYGIQAEAILLEGRSRNTYENAIFTRELLEKHGLGKVLLVTSASHMRRSVAVFRTQGMEVIPAPTDVRVVDLPPNLGSLVPTLGGLEFSTIAIKEHVGWWVYRLRGWIDPSQLEGSGSD
ncbi:MAG: YdcF family protein, partial [Gemmatimonadetes bacterium]|nr:YdcF family protein [Gemmatimonadota bacterium]